MWILERQDKEPEEKRKTEAYLRAMELNCAIVNSAEARDCKIKDDACVDWATKKSLEDLEK